MTTFPRSPRVRKGAIVAVDPFNPLASVIIFQYNPETLTRSLAAQRAEPEGVRSEAQRIKGPPQETISVRVEIDATDQLEKGEQVAAKLGVYPQLSALEMILYPKSSLVIANALLAKAGTLEVVPPEAPLTLFIWGVKRAVPVQLQSFSIEEQAFDVDLNPIRAQVSLDMRVLTYQDLPPTNLGYGLFLAHQMAKEAMAVLNTAHSQSPLGAMPGLKSLA
jgi:hypothetical protein